MSNSDKLSELLEQSLKKNQVVTDRLQSSVQLVNKFKQKCNFTRTAALPGRLLGYATFAALPLHNFVPHAYTLVGKIMVGCYITVGVVEGAIAYYNNKQVQKFKLELQDLETLRKAEVNNVPAILNQMDSLKIDPKLLQEVQNTMKPLPPFENKYEKGFLLEMIWIGGFHIGMPIVGLVGPDYYTRELVKGFIGTFAVGEVGFLIHQWNKHPASKYSSEIIKQLENEKKLYGLLKDKLVETKAKQ